MQMIDGIVIRSAENARGDHYKQAVIMFGDMHFSHDITGPRDIRRVKQIADEANAMLLVLPDMQAEVDEALAVERVKEGARR